MYTFLHNAYIFNKVYFPRLVVPFSKILFNAFRLSIQLLLYLTVYLFFMWFYKEVRPTAYLLLLPLMILVTSAFALGAGLLISVLTARYRDLDNILQFLIRLFMFATPVVYPVALVPEKYQFWFWLNPLTPVIECFRAAFFQTAAFETKYLFLSVLSTGILLMAGLLLFRKKEIEIMDII
jgi:lipopolysaccharide transport system permease protein